jgi:hypothetical protein
MEALISQENALIAFYVSMGRTFRLKETPDPPLWVDSLRMNMCSEHGPIKLWFSTYTNYSMESHLIFTRAQEEIRQANTRIREETRAPFALNIRILKKLVPVVKRVSELYMSPDYIAERDYRRLRAAAQNWIFQNSMPEALLDILGLEPVDLRAIQESNESNADAALPVEIWRNAGEAGEGSNESRTDAAPLPPLTGRDASRFTSNEQGWIRS